MEQVEGEIANHDELMSNFFAQPDALALGKTAEQCRARPAQTQTTVGPCASQAVQRVKRTLNATGYSWVAQLLR